MVRLYRIMQYIIYHLLNKFFMNPIEEEIIKHMKNTNLTVFDIGCFRGTFTKKLNKYGKKTGTDFNFFLFDPNPRVKNYIKDLLKISTVKYFDLALDNTNMKKKFFLNNFFEPSGSSLNEVCRNDKKWNNTRKFVLQLLQPFKKIESFSEINVQTQTIDNFCHSQSIKKIDVLKIDSEANELNVLKGAEKLLSKNKIYMIYTEISENKEKFDDKEKMVLDYLKLYNFKLLKTYKIKTASFLSNIKATDNILISENYLS